jgi:hypothetical protein
VRRSSPSRLQDRDSPSMEDSLETDKRFAPRFWVDDLPESHRPERAYYFFRKGEAFYVSGR